MQIIPFKEPASWQAQITLTDVIFNLVFKWNALNKYWVMSIYNRNDEPILLGVKVVVNWNLTGQFVTIGMPVGDIVCQNILGLSQVTNGQGIVVFYLPPDSFRKIERFDMGQVAELFYYEPGELAQVVAP